MHLQLSSPYSNTFTLLKRLAEAANLNSDLQRNGDMASRVAALLLLGVICVGFAAAEIVVDCCLKTTDKRLPLQIVESYTIQDAGKGCEISATGFITKVGRILCVSHPSEQKWVRSYIDILEKKKQRHQ